MKNAFVIFIQCWILCKITRCDFPTRPDNLMCVEVAAAGSVIKLEKLKLRLIFINSIFVLKKPLILLFLLREIIGFQIT